MVRRSKLNVNCILLLASISLLVGGIYFSPFNGPIVDYKIHGVLLRVADHREAITKSVSSTGIVPEERPSHRLPDVRSEKWNESISTTHLNFDPWGQPFRYRTTSESRGFIVYSVGINGIDEHGAGDDVTDSTKRYRCEDYRHNCDRNVHFAAILAMLVGFTLLVFSVSKLISSTNSSKPAGLRR